MGLFAIDADSARVRFPPPLVFVGFLLIGRAINDLFGLNPATPVAVRWILGGGAIVVGVAIMVAGLLAFRQAGNNPEPWKRDDVFVIAGIYRFTRNPMYLGMAVASFGIAVAANCLGGLLTLPLSILAIHSFVIRAEEAHLSTRFGAPYAEYRDRVRRWI